jgi:hypothetical protein
MCVRDRRKSEQKAKRTQIRSEIVVLKLFDGVLRKPGNAAKRQRHARPRGQRRDVERTPRCANHVERVAELRNVVGLCDVRDRSQQRELRAQLFDDARRRLDEALWAVKRVENAHHVGRHKLEHFFSRFVEHELERNQRRCQACRRVAELVDCRRPFVDLTYRRLARLSPTSSVVVPHLVDAELRRLIAISRQPQLARFVSVNIQLLARRPEMSDFFRRHLAANVKFAVPHHSSRTNATYALTTVLGDRYVVVVVVVLQIDRWSFHRRRTHRSVLSAVRAKKLNETIECRAVIRTTVCSLLYCNVYSFT